MLLDNSSGNWDIFSILCGWGMICLSLIWSRKKSISLSPIFIYSDNTKPCLCVKSLNFKRCSNVLFRYYWRLGHRQYTLGRIWIWADILYPSRAEISIGHFLIQMSWYFIHNVHVVPQNLYLSSYVKILISYRTYNILLHLLFFFKNEFD